MEQFVRQYVQTHEAIYNYYGEITKRTMSLAATYALVNKPFSGVALDKYSDELSDFVTKKLQDTYAFPKSAVDESFAVLMQLGEEKAPTIEELGECIQHLVDAGFPKKSSTLIATLYLTGGAEHAKRAYSLHKEMAGYHPFLTDSGDIPISVFVTQNEELNNKDIAALMYRYYVELKQYFRQGDSLQLLSQLLVLWSPTYNEHLVPYVNQLQIEFKKRKIRISKSLYYVLGILALNTSDNRVIEEVMSLYELLIQTKPLKYNKDVALQVAVRKVVQHKAQEIDATALGVNVKMNELMQTLQFIGQLPIGFSHVLTDIPFFDL